MHHCLNVVTGPGIARLGRVDSALEPVSNIEISASGPRRLCRATDIDRRLNGHDLTTGELVISDRRPRELRYRGRRRVVFTTTANGPTSRCASALPATGSFAPLATRMEKPHASRIDWLDGTLADLIVPAIEHVPGLILVAVACGAPRKHSAPSTMHPG